MIARPGLPGTHRLPLARLGRRLAVRLQAAVLLQAAVRLHAAARAGAARLRSPAHEPTRFSPDAWNAWSERGTL